MDQDIMRVLNKRHCEKSGQSICGRANALFRMAAKYLTIILFFYHTNSLANSLGLDHYVDRTLLAKDIIEDNHKALLITRPPHWGKSVCLREIEKFFSPNLKKDGSHHSLIELHKFQSLHKSLIKQHTHITDNYFGQYPTIFFSFNIAHCRDIEELYKKINLRIKYLYQKHIYINNSPNLNIEEIALFNKYADDKQALTREEMENSMMFLANMMYKHFDSQVIILVDEYDNLAKHWYKTQFASGNLHPKEDPYILEVFSLIGKMINSSIKNEKILYKAIITGTTNIAEMGLFKGVRNFREDSILDPYLAEHFGFTKDDLVHLLQDLKIDFDDKMLANIEEWYGGYNVGGLEIYNPNPIMKMLRRYHKSREITTGHVRNLMLHSDFASNKRQKELVKLLDGGSINIEASPYAGYKDTHSQTDDSFYALLIHEGFVTVQNIYKTPNGNYKCSVKIPNKEYREIFERERKVEKK